MPVEQKHKMEKQGWAFLRNFDFCEQIFNEPENNYGQMTDPKCSTMQSFHKKKGSFKGRNELKSNQSQKTPALQNQSRNVTAPGINNPVGSLPLNKTSQGFAVKP